MLGNPLVSVGFSVGIGDFLRSGTNREYLPMALSETTAKTAKHQGGSVPTKLPDGRGLYLFVLPSGTKSWRFLYRFDGRQKTLSLGIYPDISLKEAREMLATARGILAKGSDPMAQRWAARNNRKDQLSNTFEGIALEWHATRASAWTPGHADRVLTRLKNDVFPWLGNKPIADIAAPRLLEVLRRVEARGAHETAHRLLQTIGQIFRFAMATGRLGVDITPALQNALIPASKKHFAAITSPDKVGPLLRSLEGYRGSFVTRCALMLAPLVFVRPGELRTAKWKDIDFKKNEWHYEVTKTKTQHIVPLSKQAIQILEELKPLTQHSDYVFPCSTSKIKPMSNNAVLAALRRMKIDKEEMSGHGFRAMARTILDEELGWRVDLIEHQLGHAVRDPNGRAYNRTVHLSERKKMMQAWSDYLERLKIGAEVIDLKTRRNTKFS